MIKFEGTNGVVFVNPDMVCYVEGTITGVCTIFFNGLSVEVKGNLNDVMPVLTGTNQGYQ